MIAPSMISKLFQIKNDYDIIHIHHPDPMACLALFFSGYKGKVDLHWHSDILKQKVILKFYKPFQNWLIKRADLIVGTTPVYVKESPFLQKVQEKTDYIPIGINPIILKQEAVNKIKGCYLGRKIIFSLGRLVEYKGYEYLIRSAVDLPDNSVVLIGGTGPLMGSLNKLIIDLELEDKVKLIGFISDDDLPNFFNACDVFCLSSIMKTEAFAIVQIEAMSCGKPVVSTEIKGSGVSWVNLNHISGLTVETCNPSALSEALNKILTNEERYEILAKKAKNRYETEFTFDKMINSCIDFYNKLLQTF